MNARCHRLVFNRVRGMLMAVAEAAVAHGQASGNTGSANPPLAATSFALARIRPVSFAVLLALGAQLTIAPLAEAQIVAYKAAPASQQPTVLSAGNGVPLVNIQTPSAAGVSRNTYGQFDVQTPGAILNNSRSNVATQLGGWVQGNPWLAAGSARVILNEVAAGNPSQLMGYVEVAGSPAQVVIANPAGITCNGCGFINASRATLTTGTPVMSGGNLDGYRIEGGTIRIEGAGMDASRVGYTDLIARAVAVNAGLWAQTLNVTAGANVVNADNAQAAPIPGSGAAPAFAIDVAQLGGMYAGKITLVGTEAGVGVRNAGTIAASAGSATVTAEGWLVNQGTLIAGDQSLTVTARGIDNTGTLSSEQNLALSSRGEFINAGLAHAGRELRIDVAGRLSNQAGTLEGQRLELHADSLTNQAGTIRQDGTQALAVTAAQVDNRPAALIGNVTPTGDGNGSSSSGGTTPPASGDATTPSTSTGGGEVAVVPTTPVQLADGLIAVRGELVNSGTIAASGPVALTTTDGLVNAGTLTLERLTVTGTQFRNSGGIVVTDAQMNVATLDNSGGTLDIARGVDLTARDIANVQGKLRYAGADALTLTPDGRLDNRDGLIASNSADLTLSAATLDNTGGSIAHAGSGALTVSTGRIDGRSGQIESRGALTLTVDEAVLDGAFTLGDTVAVTAGTLSNRGGEIAQSGQGASAITVAGRFDNQAGSVAANGTLTLRAGDIDNRTGGQILAGGELALITTAGALANDGGTISSRQHLTATIAGDLGNAGGRIVAGTDLAVSASGRIDNTGGTLGAVAGALQATAGGTLNNAAGRIEASGNITLSSLALSNVDGTLLGQALTLDTHGQAFDNTRGRVVANGALAVASGELTNTAGLLQAVGELSIDTHGGALINTDNALSGGLIGQADVTLAAGLFDNRGGLLGAGSALTLSAERGDNAGGRLVAQDNMTLSVRDVLDNRNGDIQAGGNLSASASTRIDNTGGLMRAGGALTVSTAQLVNAATTAANRGLEGDTVTVTANDIDNRSGALRADTGSLIRSAGTFDNTGGLVSSQGSLSLMDDAIAPTLSITNTGGTLVAGTDLAVRAKRLTGDGQVLSYGDLAIDLGTDFHNTRQVAADGDARLTTAGNLTNDGTLQAGNALTVQTATLDNTATGQLLAGTDLHLTTGTLTNRGLIDGQNVRIDAGTLSNLGTGRIYGDQLALAATTLDNLKEGDAAPVIAARNRLDIGVGMLNNRDGALIFSAGDLALGGSLDAASLAIGQASAIDNASATIEALGHLTIDTASLVNRKTAFATTRVSSPTLPSDRELLAFIPELYFHWPLDESSIYAWRDGVRERYLNLITKLLGGGPDAALVAAYNQPPVLVDGGESGGWVWFQPSPSQQDEFINVWGNLTGYAGPVGGGLPYAYRVQLAAAVNAQSPLAFYNSSALWQLLLDRIAVDHPEYLATMAQRLAGQAFPLRGYSQMCNDPTDDCSYTTESVLTRTDRRDVVTVDSPNAVIRAGGNAAIHATALDNRYSRIESGGDMVLTGSTLSNVGAEFYVVSDYTTFNQVWHWAYKRKESYTSAYSTQTLVGGAPAVISAGGSLTGSFTNRIDNVTLRQNSAPVLSPTDGRPGTNLPGNIGTGTTGTGTPAATLGLIRTVATIAGAASVDATASQAVVSTIAAPALTLPANRLFHTNPTSGGRYLVETDPQFADYRQWLSSDYLLQALALDPAALQKRLGDGFYEQRLVTEQVAQLTGRRFLAGYQNDEAQYRALMDAGIAFAREWHLVPGVALTDAQMARLTTDIVWLVEQEVALPDGRLQKVLVPQVYARIREGDLSPTGALLAADNLRLETAGDLVTSGTIAGRELVSLSAENIAVLRGRVAGRDLTAQARNDLAVLGGTLEAERTLLATAGRDLWVESTTVDRSYRPPEGAYAKASVQRTDIDRIAGLYVTGSDGTLVASAGRDLVLRSAVVANGAAGETDASQTRLIAGRDLTLGTVAASYAASTATKKHRWSEQSSTEVGARIAADGDLTLDAGNDLTARAVDVTSGGNLLARAGNDLVIESGEASRRTEFYMKSSGGSGFSKRSSVREDKTSDTFALGSTFSGDSVTLVAGNDLGVKGSNVVATNDTTLVAGRNLTIEAASETHAESHYAETKKSGLFSSGGVGVTIGSQQTSTDQQRTTTTAVKSTVGSVEGNVMLLAGESYRQVGSDVMAPQGDIDIAAKRGDIVEAREGSQSTIEQKSKQSGLTLAITSPVITAVQTAREMHEAAQDTDDPRMKALAAANTALAVKSAADAVKAGQGVTTPDGKTNQIPTGRTNPDGSPEYRDASAAEQVGGVNLSLSIGGSKSSSQTTQRSDTAVGSNLTAGGDIRIVASGAGQDSDITLQGAKVAAAGNVTLSAEDELRLLAAKNSADQKSTNKNSSGSVGISFGTDGLLFNVGASAGRGKADGNDLAWTNTRVEAGQTIVLASGGDTTLRGAVAKGEQVVANIGGDLLIESLQDTSTYDSRQKSLGGSLSIGYGRMSGSVSASGSKVTSDYASVVEQSGIRAGDRGFQVDVKGNTDLKGGAITSTQQAVDENLNRFETGGTLTLSDIQNKAEYDAKSFSVNVGTGYSPTGKLVPQGTSAGLGQDSDSASSTTLAAISGIAGNTEARTGDRETGIGKIFDADKVQREIDAQTKITQLFGQQASSAVEKYTGERRAQLQDQLRRAESDADKAALKTQLDDLRTEERVMNILIGAVTGQGGSVAAKEGLAAAADEMRELMVEQSRPTTGITGVIDSTTGKVLSNASGESAGMNGDATKLGGVRLDLDLLCGKRNERCATQKDDKSNDVLDENGIPRLALEDGKVVFTATDANDKPISLDDFIKTPDGQKMVGPTGGIQGYKGTLFGMPYEAGSWQDKLIESFAGSHDYIGGHLPGLYDAQGNIRRGMSDAERFVYDNFVTTAAIPAAAPFAAAQGLPPEVWQAIALLLRAAR